MLDFDEDAYLKEQEEKRRQKLKRYESSLGFLLEQTSEKGEISLSDIWKNIQENEKNAEEMQQQLIPNVEIFKEIMVELIKNQQIDIRALRKERSEYIREKADSFQLNEMLLDLADRQGDPIQRIEVYRLEDGKVIEFGRVKSEDGRIKRVACSNVLLRVIREDR